MALNLYIKNGCPYCKKVIDQVGTTQKLTLCDVQADAQHRGNLVVLGGKMMVPFLHDTDTNIGMYESADIIAHLASN